MLDIYDELTDRYGKMPVLPIIFLKYRFCVFSAVNADLHLLSARKNNVIFTMSEFNLAKASALSHKTSGKASVKLGTAAYILLSLQRRSGIA